MRRRREALSPFEAASFIVADTGRKDFPLWRRADSRSRAGWIKASTMTAFYWRRH